MAKRVAVSTNSEHNSRMAEVRNSTAVSHREFNRTETVSVAIYHSLCTERTTKLQQRSHSLSNSVLCKLAEQQIHSRRKSFFGVSTDREERKFNHRSVLSVYWERDKAMDEWVADWTKNHLPWSRDQFGCHLDSDSHHWAEVHSLDRSRTTQASFGLGLGEHEKH